MILILFKFYCFKLYQNQANRLIYTAVFQKTTNGAGI